MKYLKRSVAMGVVLCGAWLSIRAVENMLPGPGQQCMKLGFLGCVGIALLLVKMWMEE